MDPWGIHAARIDLKHAAHAWKMAAQSDIDAKFKSLMLAQAIEFGFHKFICTLWQIEHLAVDS